jgi:ribosome-associated protein
MTEDLIEDEYDGPSKSQLKREMQALRDFGQTLLDLKPSQQDILPLPEDLREALSRARSIHSNLARKRHKQYIGKILRHVDVAAIQSALDLAHQVRKPDMSHLEKIEKLRDALLTNGDVALNELIANGADIDRNHLRQLIRQATKTGQDKYRQAILKYLKETIQ